MIINLPVTVEMSMPHVYANQIEYCDKHLKYRDSVIISTHPHNDRGTGVACAELAVLAGAQRVECCLFGNGERTGNVDAVTLAMNMYSHGVDPKLDFSDMPAICATYERVTRMHIYERTPYAGQLVFAAFSGSHQDAIAKGMAYRKQTGEHRWTCPYIPVDPHDIGRTYDADVIRINSQSGKGGIGFVLEQNYGYNLSPKMREALGYKVKSVSDHSHKELSAAEVLHIFEDTYLNRAKPLNVVEAHFAQVNGITATVTLELNGQRKVVTSVGNGRLDAVANAIQSATGMEFHLECPVQSVEDSPVGAKVVCKDKSGNTVSFEAEKVLVAIGRKANTAGLDLAAGKIDNDKGRILVNDKMETNVPGVYAIGDCVFGHAQLAHTASAMGEVASENICGLEAHYCEKTNPTCVYMEPEAASVGLTEEQCKAQGIAYKVGKFPMSANGKALILNGGEGLVKIIAGKKYGEILGMHIIGPRATDLIAEGALAIEGEMTLDEIIDTIHSHPTVTETMREAALNAEKRAIHTKN